MLDRNVLVIDKGDMHYANKTIQTTPDIVIIISYWCSIPALFIHVYGFRDVRTTLSPDRSSRDSWSGWIRKICLVIFVFDLLSLILALHL